MKDEQYLRSRALELAIQYTNNDDGKTIELLKEIADQFKKYIEG